MSQAINDLYEGGYPHYNDLGFATCKAPGKAFLYERCPSDSLEHLAELEDLKNGALLASKEYIDKNGYPDPTLQSNARLANQKYQQHFQTLLSDHPEVFEPVHRGDVDTSAPGRISEKIRIPIMAASAAMRMLMDPRSGYYEGVEKLNGSIDARFATEFARNGGMPIIPLDVTIADAEQLLAKMNGEHLVYRSPVFVEPSTSVGKVRELLMGQVHDVAAYVMDDKKLLRVISRSDVELGDEFDQTKRKIEDSETVQEHFPLSGKQQKVITAPVGISPSQALRMMQDNLIRQLPLVDKAGVVQYVFSETHAALSEELEPFRMNAMFTVGIGPFNDMAERIDALMDASAVGFFIETAHAFRTDVLKKAADTVKSVRERYPNAIIGFGTVTEPEAVEVLSTIGIDIVKVGVGGGGHCSTFNVTGVGGLPFRSFRECARTAEALGNIQIMADGGVSNTRRFNLAASNEGTALVQFGSWAVTTAEAASKASLNKDGKWVKLAYGEASDHAEERRRKERSNDSKYQSALEKMAPRIRRDEILGIHSEGKVSYPEIPYEGPNSHIGGVLLQIRRGLASWVTYSDSKDIEHAQRNSHIMRISNTPT